MCGIAGIYSKDKGWVNECPHLYQMQRVMGHRGPDDAGVDVLPEHGVGLVHTRLSVIDLSPAGHQPMWNNDKSIGLVFNGEIYNFPELRRQLESMGTVFHSHTDTEVILRGYETWGIDVVDRLNGMFAFALWDGKQRLVWLVRDRLGKKPVYYWHDATKGILLFASEIKALLEWPCIRRKVDPSALHCYLTLGYVPSPHTMFDGIKKLPAAHWLRYDAHDLEIRRYWNVSALGTWQASPQEYRQHIRGAVEQAVERRLISDVPLGAFLSGGVDSSIVVGLMSRLMKEPVRTFSAAFDVGAASPKYNVDADAADLVSQSFGTRHTRFVVKTTDDLFETLKKVVWHLDEPHANPTLLSTFTLARLVKQQGITVTLSGDGSDEIFAGYDRYMDDRYLSWARLVPKPIRHAIRNVARYKGNSERFVKALNKADLSPFSPERYMTWWNIFSPQERAAILPAPWCHPVDAPNQCIQSVLDSVSTSNDQEFQCYADLALWISEESNMRLDKMSMAHALEVRSPFLDYHLVEQAMAIPFEQKVGWRESKQLLKNTFADLLPDFVLKRQKWGWQAPAHYWLTGSMWKDAEKLIKWLPETGIFSPKVCDLVDNYHWTHAQRVWTLMVFALWHQEFIGSA